MKRLARTLWDDPMLVIAPALPVGASIFFILVKVLGITR